MADYNPAFILKPRGIGELLDQAIRVYRANFLRFVGIIALVEIPVGLLQILSSNSLLKHSIEISANSSAYASDNPFAQMIPLLGDYGLTFLTSLLSFILVSGLGNAALSRALADGYLGEPSSIMGAYRKIGKQMPALILAMLFFLLVNFAALIWTAIPCFGWLTGFGLVAFLCGAVLPLIGPIIALENRSANNALRRAWDLSRARFWWFIGFVGILYVFNILIVTAPVMILSLFVSTPLQQASIAAGSASQEYMLYTAIQQVIAILLTILYTSLQSTAITLAYFDLRVRLEGFDLAVQTLAPDANPVDQLTQAPTIQVMPKFIDWNDILHFLLLSLIAVGIYVVLVMIVGLFGVGAALLMGGLG